MISQVHPRRWTGVLVGTVIAFWCYAFTIALLWRGLTADIDVALVGLYLASALFFALGSLFLYWTYGCWTLEYDLDRNGLTIRWGDIRQHIPMDRIERLVPGGAYPSPKISGVNWMGHHIGKADVEGLGPVLVYATNIAAEDLLYVVTQTQTYGISVSDEARFAADLQGHQTLGQLVSLPQVTERTAIAAQPFWHDPIAQGLAMLSVLAFAVTCGYVFQQYPDLPNSIPFAFPSLGSVTRVDDKDGLLAIPMTGIGLLAINLVLGYLLHAWDRAVGYLLFLAASGMQVMLLAAAIITIHQ